MLSLPLSWEERNPLKPLSVAGGTAASLSPSAMGPLHDPHGYSGWGGLTPRGETKFSGDVGLVDIALWVTSSLQNSSCGPCALPGQFWIPVLRCGGRG